MCKKLLIITLLIALSRQAQEQTNQTQTDITDSMPLPFATDDIDNEKDLVDKEDHKEEKIKPVEESSKLSAELVLMLFLLVINNFIINKINRLKRQRPSLEPIQNTLITTTIGIICGLILHLFHAKSIESTIKNTFEPIFMIVLLPPILFSSALKMNKFFFFKNFGTILLYSFVGTLIAIIMNTFLMYLWSFSGVGLYIPVKHGFVFSTLVSATDPVSVLATFEGFHADQNLYSLIFGESIFNDAISLGIYRSILIDSKNNSQWRFVMDTSLRFGIIVIFSTILGIATGIISGYLLKKINYWTSITEKQISMMSQVLEVNDWEHINENNESLSNIDLDSINTSPKIITKDREEDQFNNETRKADDRYFSSKLDEVISDMNSEVKITEKSLDQIEAYEEENDIFKDKTSKAYKTQLLILKKLVISFSNYMNQELTIMLVTPILSYLIAEVS